MPTILSHPAAALGLRRFFAREPLPRRVVAAGIAGTIAPDLDVAGFRFGVPYGSTFGHRGFTHSIVFAALFALAAARLAPRGTRAKAFAFLFVSTLSHPIFDALTNGGLGVAFFSPFSNRRYFFPWTPIRVSPIGRLDLRVVASEVKWVWLPCAVLGAIGYFTRKRR